MVRDGVGREARRLRVLAQHRRRLLHHLCGRASQPELVPQARHLRFQLFGLRRRLGSSLDSRGWSAHASLTHRERLSERELQHGFLVVVGLGRHTWWRRRVLRWRRRVLRWRRCGRGVSSRSSPAARIGRRRRGYCARCLERRIRRRFGRWGARRRRRRSAAAAPKRRQERSPRWRCTWCHGGSSGVRRRWRRGSTPTAAAAAAAAAAAVTTSALSHRPRELLLLRHSRRRQGR